MRLEEGQLRGSQEIRMPGTGHWHRTVSPELSAHSIPQPLHHRLLWTFQEPALRDISDLRHPGRWENHGSGTENSLSSSLFSLCLPTLTRAENQSQSLPETHFLTCQMPGVSRTISKVTSNSNDLWLDSIPSVKVNRASLLCFTVYSFFWGHYPPNGTTESTWESKLYILHIKFGNCNHYWKCEFHHELNHNMSRYECPTGPLFSLGTYASPQNNGSMRELCPNSWTAYDTFRELIVFQKWSSWIAKKWTKLSTIQNQEISNQPPTFPKKYSIKIHHHFFPKIVSFLFF